MTIAFKCPECGVRTEVAEHYAGQSGPCASCGTYVTVPGSSAMDTSEYGSGGGVVKPVVFVGLAFVLCVVIVFGLVMSLVRPEDREVSVAQVSATDALIDDVDQLRLIPVDMQPHSNKQLSEDFSNAAGINLAELPQGDVKFTVSRRQAADREVEFQVGPGFIHLRGQKLPKLPKRVDGIRVDRACRAVCFLQGAQWGQPGNVRVGTRVGYYVVHYEDASKELIPIEYGRDVRDWYDNRRPVTRGSVVWKGRSQSTRRSTNGNLRMWLYLRAWKNPKPDIKIASIDFVSTDSTEVSPYCVAISVAVDPGDPVFLDERRHVEIVPAGSRWKWLHPTDGVDPAEKTIDFHTQFTAVGFDDSDWNADADSAGAGGGFGYGQAGNTEIAGVEIGTPERLNSQGETLRKTAYFRHYFSTHKDYEYLVVTMQRDDGVIIYIDGEEVGRDNVEGEEAYDLKATHIISGADESHVNEFRLKGSLTAGDHVLAVSLHNRAGGSSDLRIAEISLHGVPIESDENDVNDDVVTTVDAGDSSQLDNARQAAVALIERLGGTWEIVEGEESKSVVSVSLRATDATDDDLRQLANLVGMEFLDLGSTQISDAGLEHLKLHTKLQRLVLSDTNIGDPGMAALTSLTELQFLQLAGTEVSDAGLQHLAGMAELRILTLNGTRVTDEGLAHLKSLEHLETLNLYDTAVTGKGVKTLSEALPKANISH